ncbi:DUF6146 family protein [Xanthomarina sp. F2636L]|uniref:DUF6146 family protein n=1 Tax=Xanthomarina sp. F2636L TaxID=2996018 RepID=UPI00225DFF9A|nr:DUF6146 family protein [Xanthomarina sp. F2636L]MCX7549732.1 DUF6146 family protein [Xanthomarina sp. F2636L]
MKYLLYILLIFGFLFSCNSAKSIDNTSDNENIHVTKNDTVSIANNDLEYELIIIEPGYNIWLETRARPIGYYEQDFLETRNKQYVDAWNERVLHPLNYPSGLYDSQIYYDKTVDYGYEVNYKLYNYFIYFQLTYKQQLTSYIPRI